MTTIVTYGNFAANAGYPLGQPPIATEPWPRFASHANIKAKTQSPKALRGETEHAEKPT